MIENVSVPYMDIRTWLVGQALAGLCANPRVSDDFLVLTNETQRNIAQNLGLMAAKVADATMAELRKNQ